ncbi:MAG TPA: type II CAAX endopeptidase family protein [Fimbriimonas sp.]|nr:type II CAAX endopeptidase family protein [Fimbriimonas sp.]
MDLNPKAKFDLGSEPPPAPEQVPFQVEYPREPEAPLKRLPWAQYLFFVLIGFLIFDQIYENLNQPKGQKLQAEASNFQVEMTMATRSMSGSQSGQKMFEAYLDTLVTKAKTDPETQKLRVALRTEDKDKPFLADLQNLSKSKVEEDRAFAELYSEKKLDKKQTEALLKKIKIDTLPERIAKVQALEKLGDKSIRSKEFPVGKFVPLISAAFLGCLLLPVGLGLWVYYSHSRGKGKLVPLMQPFSDAQPAHMDRLFFAASCVIGAFVGSSLILGLLVQAVPSLAPLAVLTYVAVFGSTFALLKFPIFGWRITPEALGLKGISGAKAAGWGFGAWAANIPVMLVVMGITAAISQYLPNSTHPAAEQLLANPSPTTILKVLFMAAVLAPLWEEVLFRGFLFPAFSTLTKNPIYGALLSSVCFAAIHPQGLLGVIPLATIAMMLCAVTYQTRSLIPGMIFHSVHNAVTLLLALSVGYAS